MKKTILFIMMLTLVSFIYATNVISVDDAKRVSKNFLTEITGSNFTVENFILTETITDNNGEAAYYNFQIENGGFILVSATDLARPVLAFSFESDANSNSSDNYFMLKYKEEISQLKANPSLANNFKSEWNHYNTTNFIPRQSKSGEGVQPLTTTTWSQEQYYNAYCPFDGRVSTAVSAANRDYHALVGCVAVTMTNLLFYHRHPEHGNAGISYIPMDVDDEGEILFTYPRQTVNFAANTYNYNAMTGNTLNSYVNELAKTFYHTGVSATLSYGAEGTGGNSTSAVSALTTNWKMDPLANVFSKADVTANEFKDSLIAQLDRNLPVYFSATISGADGHAFIVDGYLLENETPYFHVNFGWAGYKNGYYAYANFDGYNADENILINVFPADGAGVKPAVSADTVTAYLGSISDGSGAYKYAANSNRTWLVQAPLATSYRLDFSKIKTEADNDVISIYEGNSISTANLVGTYSGDYLTKYVSDDATASNGNGAIEYNNFFSGLTLPGTITVNSSEFLVVFTSDDNNIEDYGFVLEYEAVYPTSGVATCSSNPTMLTSIVGTISDKGTSTDTETNYLPERACDWRGYFTFLSGVSIGFPHFDLAGGDYIEIMDVQDNLVPVLLYRFDATNVPDGSYILPTSRIRVKFISDNWKEGTGFLMDYYGIVGINENSNLNDITVYPNPATDLINVSLSTTKEEVVTFQIVDMMGKVISSEVQTVNGEHIYTANTSSLSAGIYMMRVLTNGGKTIHKFIVE